MCDMRAGSRDLTRGDTCVELVSMSVVEVLRGDALKPAEVIRMRRYECMSE